MKLTGHACTETLNEAEKARTRKKKSARAGGVRVERRVRAMVVESMQSEPHLRIFG